MQRFDARGDEPAGLRRAALMVHALRANDRDWLLGQLQPSERQRLQPLLEELAAMALPRDPAFAKEALQRCERHPSDVSVSDDPLHRLDRLSATAVHRAVREECDAFIAQLLSTRVWAWTPGLLERLDPRRQTSIRKLTTGSGSGAPRCTEFDRALAVEVLARAERPEGAGTQAAAEEGRERLFVRIRATAGRMRRRFQGGAM